MADRPRKRRNEERNENQFSCVSGRAGDLLVTALQSWWKHGARRWKFTLLVTRRAKYYLGHFVELLSSRGTGDALKSAHLYAPACTVVCQPTLCPA